MSKLTSVDQDYQGSRAWLLTYVDAVRNDLNDSTKFSILTKKDQYDGVFDALTLCDAIEKCLEFSDLTMRQGNRREKIAINQMLGHYKRTLAATPMISKYIETTISALGAADNRKSETAREAKSALKEARMAIVRPLILAAPRKADGSLEHPKKLLPTVNKALAETKDSNGKQHKSIGLRTMLRYDAEEPKPAYR